MNMVNEEQANKGTQQATTAQDTNAGNKSQGSELIERARQEAERLAKENERLENNLRELRELEASRLLGGTAGGRVEPQAPKVETAREYADKVLNGYFNKK